MKVTKTGSSSTNLGTLKGGGGKESAKSEAAQDIKSISSIEEPDEITTFEDIVTKYSEEVSKLELDKLIKEVDELGQALAHTGSMQVYGRYKATITEFLKKIVPDLYQITNKKHRRFIDNNKIYFIGEKINKKLKELADEILSNQNKNIKIISKIDEIKGLVVDITIMEGNKEEK